MFFLNRCCQLCSDGTVVPEAVNSTQVRNSAGSPAAPYSRFDKAQHLADSGSTACDTPGTCGPWLVNGDLNGLPTKDISRSLSKNPLVNDIIACTGGDASLDHNCYHASGTILNRVYNGAYRFGMQAVLAQKYWQGVLPWDSNDACTPVSTETPSQTRYRTCASSLTWQTRQTNSSGNVTEINCTSSGSVTVDKDSGIKTSTLLTTQDTYLGPNSIGASLTQIGHISGGAGWYTSGGVTTTWPSGQSTKIDGVAITDLHCATIHIPGSEDSTYPDGWNLESFIGYWNSLYPSETLPTVSNRNSYSGSATHTGTPGSYDSVTISWTRTATTFTFSFVRHTTDTDTTYFYFGTNLSFSGTLTLSNPYTAADCYGDGINLLNQVSTSDFALGQFRTDEKLAAVPMIVRDEVVGDLLGSFVPYTMDDYNSPIADWRGTAPWTSIDPAAVLPWVYDYMASYAWIPTYTQIPWKDPNDYTWTYSDGDFQYPSGVAYGGATLNYPRRTGAVVSHTPAGYARHFWFDYHHLQRQFSSSLGYNIWLEYKLGDYSQSPLPDWTMRWQTNKEAQYDANAGGHGNYPQAWIHQEGQLLQLCKYVQAAMEQKIGACAASNTSWKAVNYGRPCGPDKYTVKQTSACCITGGSTGAWTVKTTGFAASPGTTGGVNVNDYILVEGSGIFKVTSITGSGPTWTINTGAIIDTLPTGYTTIANPDQVSDGANHLGTLRWPSSSGICGRAAITTTESGGTVTIAATSALPYLRKDPATGTIVVDIYDSAMTLLQASAVLTRVSDSSFTLSHAAMPTAAWMTGAGVDYTAYDDTPKRSAVYLDWTLGTRASGATTKSQFTYSTGACRCVAGILPSGSPENFTIQNLFPFPSTFQFDSAYGSHWQAMVAFTQPDPFWEEPYEPDCDGSSFAWREDTGDGVASATIGATNYRYYPHRPFVEACIAPPTSRSLPADAPLHYAGTISAPYYPNGLPIGDDSSGDYGSFETDYGFASRAFATIAASRPFSSVYAGFFTCS